MNYVQYCKELQEEREFLDSLPLEKYIKDWIEIYDMMQQIEEDYGKLRPSGFVFNVTGIDDFLIYTISSLFRQRIRGGDYALQ